MADASSGIGLTPFGCAFAFLVIPDGGVAIYRSSGRQFSRLGTSLMDGASSVVVCADICRKTQSLCRGTACRYSSAATCCLLSAGDRNAVMVIGLAALSFARFFSCYHFPVCRVVLESFDRTRLALAIFAIAIIKINKGDLTNTSDSSLCRKRMKGKRTWLPSGSCRSDRMTGARCDDVGGRNEVIIDAVM